MLYCFDIAVAFQLNQAMLEQLAIDVTLPQLLRPCEGNKTLPLCVQMKWHCLRGYNMFPKKVAHYYIVLICRKIFIRQQNHLHISCTFSGSLGELVPHFDCILSWQTERDKDKYYFCLCPILLLKITCLLSLLHSINAVCQRVVLKGLKVTIQVEIHSWNTLGYILLLVD